MIPAYAISPEAFTALAPNTTVYSTESNRSAPGFNLTTSASKLNSSKEIGTVLPDPLGVADSTSSKDPNCTVSENLNTRFPLAATNAAERVALPCPVAVATEARFTRVARGDVGGAVAEDVVAVAVVQAA